MKYDIIKTNTSLGLNMDGTELGPTSICDRIDKGNINEIIDVKNDFGIKEHNLDNMHRNERGINKITKKVYELTMETLNNSKFPIIVGGDHSTVIGSALATNTKYENIGIIWIDAHGDFNTFETTTTGNIHGLPLAAICNYQNRELTNFLHCNYISSNNCVIVGGRSIDPLEMKNINNTKATIIDIKKSNIKESIMKAIDIACKDTNGIYVSFDLDIIDPQLAPGVSVPENNGITPNEALEIVKIIAYEEKVKAFDIVEYNPLRDNNDETREIAVKLLNCFLNEKN